MIIHILIYTLYRNSLLYLNQLSFLYYNCAAQFSGDVTDLTLAVHVMLLHKVVIENADCGKIKFPNPIAANAAICICFFIQDLLFHLLLRMKKPPEIFRWLEVRNYKLE